MLPPPAGTAAAAKTTIESAPALGSRAWGGARPRALTAAIACGMLTLVLYYAGLAPGYTWAHHAADGGDLLAAAMTNGVPHPPGYPLYTVLLRGWIILGTTVAPGSDVAWWGNLLSALSASAAVAITVWTLAHLPLPDNHGSRSQLPLQWAALGGLLWGLGPLLWSQALVTEVYALHALGVALLGWAAFTPGPAVRFLPGALLATSHHPTLLLLLPAALYAAVQVSPDASGPPATRDPSGLNRSRLKRVGLWIGVGLLAGGALHMRTLFVASGAPPVNWGYADSWRGLWWLVSGAAYHNNFLAGGLDLLPARLGAWLGTLLREVVWVGLLPMLVALAWFDAEAPRLRTAALLWVTPLSLYTLLFVTRDSEVNLVGVSWMLTLCVAAGLSWSTNWAASRRLSGAPLIVAVLAALWVAGVTMWRWPILSLRGDSAARAFLSGAAVILERHPDAIVVTRSDVETFALWYGTWAAAPVDSASMSVLDPSAGGAIGNLAPGLLPVNDALFQFDWYQRLMRVRSPGVAGAGYSAQDIVRQNAGVRPIYFTEPLEWAAANLVPEPPLWRYEVVAADDEP